MSNNKTATEATQPVTSATGDQVPHFTLTQRAVTLVTFWSYLKQLKANDSDHPIWDDLDDLIELALTDDPQDPQRLVNELLDFTSATNSDIRDWDHAEEIAMRVISERDLRFPLAAPKFTTFVNVSVSNPGTNPIDVIETLDELTGIGRQPATDIVEGQVGYAAKDIQAAHSLKAHLENAGATVTLAFESMPTAWGQLL